MNRTILVGRLTQDPELRTTPNGIATTRITVAVDRIPNANGERVADFINVVVWRRQAENVAKYCTKGSLVGVDGRIQSRSYDAQDGSKRYVTEVQADRIEFLTPKGGNSGFQNSHDNSSDNYSGNVSNDVATTDITEDPFKDFGDEVALSDDDLPF